MKKEQIKYILRNVSRKKKQSFFTMLCITVSSFIILGNISLNNGIQAKLKEGINQAISGQLTVYSANDSKVNILESQLKEQRTFHWNTADAESFKNISTNISINRRIRFGSLVSYEEETSYVNIHALETSHLDRIKNLITIKYGKMPKKSKDILISETTADDLHCNIGDTILLVAENINDYMSDEVAVITGIFEEKGLAIFLNYTAFMSYGFGEEIVQIEEDQCLELIINSTTGSDIPDKTISQIKEKLNTQADDINIASWDKTVPLFYKIANIWKGSGYITQAIFIVFSLVILINLASLIVYSRKKEFGTLLAVGFSWRKITIMVSLEYLLITCIAVLTAYILTLLFIYSLPDTLIHISSKEMQSALMAESIKLFLHAKDLLYVLLLFCLTILAAVLISISRIKRLSPIALINNI